MTKNYAGGYCTLHTAAYVLVLIGALNWGLIGLGELIGINLNIVNILFGSWSVIEYLIYILVGLSAVAMLFRGSCGYCRENLI